MTARTVEAKAADLLLPPKDSPAELTARFGRDIGGWLWTEHALKRAEEREIDPDQLSPLLRLMDVSPDPKGCANVAVARADGADVAVHPELEPVFGCEAVLSFSRHGRFVVTVVSRNMTPRRAMTPPKGGRQPEDYLRWWKRTRAVEALIGSA